MIFNLCNIFSLKKDSESNAPGELPQFLGVREQVWLVISFAFLRDACAGK